MIEFFVENINSVIFVPFWAFLMIILGKYFAAFSHKKTIFMITLAATLYSLCFAAPIFLHTIENPDFTSETFMTFLQIEGVLFSFGTLIDRLSAQMFLIVGVVSLLVQIYSYWYMKADESFPRFFAYLNLFNFSMLGLTLSSNLFQTYVFWELVGVSSYLLIGFWYKKRSASKAAKKAFLMNRIGDIGFMSALIISAYFMYNYSNNVTLTTLPFTEIGKISAFLTGYMTPFAFGVLCVMFLAASVAKSAQFPLQTWLVDAMEGPTPVSALIHSATMVAAGVYLLIRLFPLYELCPFVLNLIVAIGVISAFIGAFSAITQTDLKRILAYSTISQLGLMFWAVGMGALTAGMFHLTTHAFVKSMLFLCAGIVIHVTKTQDIRFMGGLSKKSPVVSTCFLLGAIGLSGLMFGGFYSKELILASIINPYMQSAFVILSLLTAFYIFRTYFLVFAGNYRGAETLEGENKFSLVAPSVLMLVTVFFFIFYHYPIEYNSECVVNIAFVLLGLLIAVYLYRNKLRAKKIPCFYAVSLNGVYFDRIYSIFPRIYAKLAYLFELVEEFIFDGLVSVTVIFARINSWICSKMQTGNVQSYLAYSLLLLAIIFAGVMIAYTWLLNVGEV